MKDRYSLLMGIGIISIGLFLFGGTLFTFKSNLIEKTGLIEGVDVTYEIVYYRGYSSYKAQLIINLKNDPKTYIIAKNVGNSYFYERYEKLKREIRKLRKVTIFIKSSDSRNNLPRVFGINKESGEEIYTFKEAKQQSWFGFLCSLFFGLMFIGKSKIEKYWTYKLDEYYLNVFNKSKLILLRLIGPTLAISFGVLFYGVLRSDQPFNIVSLIFGVLTVIFTCGTIMFELSLKNQQG